MINYHLLTQSAYVNLLSELITGFEGHHSVAENIGDGKATIGYGYTFNRSDNLSLWTAAGINLSDTDRAILESAKGGSFTFFSEQSCHVAHALN